MPEFSESNITLNFPDNNFFRFSEYQGYAKLSGNNFKEMDACWYDVAQNIYWLIELKDFSIANLYQPETIKEKALDLVKKSVDSLCMFLSSKHSYEYANTNLNPCFPIPLPNEDTKFKLITIIHCDDNQKSSISLINEQFRNRFIPYAKLFGIIHFSVVEHSSAVNIIPNNLVS